MYLRIAVALLAVVALPAEAQSPSGWSLDASLGVGSVYSGSYISSAGPAVEAVLTRGVRRGLVLSLAANGQSDLPHGDQCLPDGKGGCLEALPTVSSLGIYVGRDWRLAGRDRAWSVRGGAGFGLYRASIDYQRAPRLGGIHGRLDFVSPGRHLAFITTARSAYVPALPRGARGTYALSIGVRVR